MKLSHRTRGIVHVYYNSAWETVCDDGFGQEEADVICRQVNGKTAVSWDGKAGAVMPSEFASGNIGQTDRPLLDDLACLGTESTLFNCPHSGYFNENCADSENAWVVCEP